MTAAKKTAKKRISKNSTPSAAPPDVLLAIDPGITSGWAIWLHGALHDSGVATKPEHRAAVVDAVADLCEDGDPRHVVVAIERGLHGGAKTVFGMGRAEGRWVEHLELWGVKPKAIVRYTASMWRRRLWGTIVMKGKKKERRAQWKLRALTWVQTYHGVAASTDDEAEAILIGDAHLHPKPPKKAAKK